MHTGCWSTKLLGQPPYSTGMVYLNKNACPRCSLFPMGDILRGRTHYWPRCSANTLNRRDCMLTLMGTPVITAMLRSHRKHLSARVIHAYKMYMYTTWPVIFAAILASSQSMQRDKLRWFRATRKFGWCLGDRRAMYHAVTQSARITTNHREPPWFTFLRDLH